MTGAELHLAIFDCLRDVCREHKTISHGQSVVIVNQQLLDEMTIRVAILFAELMTSESKEQCGQCGAVVLGHHACQGVPE